MLPDTGIDCAAAFAQAQAPDACIQGKDRGQLHQDRERQPEAKAGLAMRIFVRLRRSLQVHEHDDEQVQHDDAACIHEHLNGGEELRAEEDVQRGHEQEVEHQEQHAMHRILRRHDQDGEAEDERGEGVERDRFAHYCTITFTMPVTTRFTIAIGISTFHPSRISWS